MSIDIIDAEIVPSATEAHEIDDLYEQGVAMQNRGTLVIAEAVRRARDAYGSSFPAWYQGRGLARDRVSQLCRAAEVVRWVVENFQHDAIANEGQALALASVPEEHRADVLDRATADGDKLTARAITEAYAELTRPAVEQQRSTSYAPRSTTTPADPEPDPTPEPVRVTTTQTTSETHVVDPATGEVLDEPLDFEDDGPPPQVGVPLPRRAVMDDASALRDNQQREVETFAEALSTLHALLTPEHRQRVHDAWRHHPEGARPHARALHVPETMHRLADVLHTYAAESEQGHA